MRNEISKGINDLLNAKADNLETYGKSTSTIGRQLAYAGIAIVWLFHIEVDGTIHLPGRLAFALFWIVCFLLFDFLHGVASLLVWGIVKPETLDNHVKGQERRWWIPVLFDISERPIGTDHTIRPRTEIILLLARILSLLVGYITIMVYLLGHLHLV